MPSVERQRWQADCARYPRFPLLRCPVIWPLAVYRLRRWARSEAPVPVRGILAATLAPLRTAVGLMGIELPVTCDIGGGLWLPHLGPIVVHRDTVIGRNALVRHGVTFGDRHIDSGAPVIGDDCEFGAYAQVLGGVRIGDRVTVGALSLVLEDLPDDAVAIGIPARVVRRGQRAE